MPKHTIRPSDVNLDDPIHRADPIAPDAKYYHYLFEVSSRKSWKKAPPPTNTDRPKKLKLSRKQKRIRKWRAAQRRFAKYGK